MRSIAKVFLVVPLLGVLASSTAFAADHTVLMNGDYFGNMFFDPPTITVNVGDRVRWSNVTTVIHTATRGSDCLPDGGFNTGSINPGAFSAYVTFSAISTATYYCRFHCEMGMTGEIVVQQAPVKTQSTTWGRIKALYTPAK
ncbi:MAG TPA: plastocyanin/azurin family copper-binding protein [Candidatus Krumholzibacteria bacterium]